MTDSLISYVTAHPWHSAIDFGLACAVLRTFWLLRKGWSEPSEQELWERFQSGAWR